MGPEHATLDDVKVVVYGERGNPDLHARDEDEYTMTKELETLSFEELKERAREMREVQGEQNEQAAEGEATYPANGIGNEEVHPVQTEHLTAYLHSWGYRTDDTEANDLEAEDLLAPGDEADGEVEEDPIA